WVLVMFGPGAEGLARPVRGPHILLLARGRRALASTDQWSYGCNGSCPGEGRSRGMGGLLVGTRARRGVGAVIRQAVPMAEDAARQVTLVRVGLGRYEVRNVRGGSITIGAGGDGEFTPVELLLAAIGGCTAIDVDFLTARRAEPESFQVIVTGDKVRDEGGGNRMVNLAVRFAVGLPNGPAGDAAGAVLPVAVATSHDRLCTVSRTVEAGTPVSIEAT